MITLTPQALGTNVDGGAGWSQEAIQADLMMSHREVRQACVAAGLPEEVHPDWIMRSRIIGLTPTLLLLEMAARQHRKRGLIPRGDPFAEEPEPAGDARLTPDALETGLGAANVAAQIWMTVGPEPTPGMPISHWQETHEAECAEEFQEQLRCDHLVGGIAFTFSLIVGILLVPVLLNVGLWLVNLIFGGR